MKPFPQLRYHAASKEYYIWRDKRREYLGRSFEDANRRYCILRGEHDRKHSANPITSSNRTLAVAELLIRYLDSRMSDHADARELGRIRAASRAVRPLFAATPADDFRAKALKAVRQMLIDAPPRKRSKATAKVRHIKPRGEALALSRRYINHIVDTIKVIWQWGVSEEMVHPETWQSLRSVRSLRIGKGGRETGRITPVTPDVVTATLPYINQPVATMVCLQQLAGMRPGELVRLRRRDVSTTQAEKITLPHSNNQLSAFDADGVSVWVAIPDSHKTLYRGKPRVIVLGPKAQAILQPLLGIASDAFLFSPRRHMRGKLSDYSTRAPGEHYTTQSYGRAIGVAVERANKVRAAAGLEPLPHWRPNQLRHHVATEVAEAFDRPTASAVLGNGADVIGTYVEQELRKAAKAAVLLG